MTSALLSTSPSKPRVSQYMRKRWSSKPGQGQRQKDMTCGSICQVEEGHVQADGGAGGGGGGGEERQHEGHDREKPTIHRQHSSSSPMASYLPTPPSWMGHHSLDYWLTVYQSGGDGGREQRDRLEGYTVEESTVDEKGERWREGVSERATRLPSTARDKPLQVKSCVRRPHVWQERTKVRSYYKQYHHGNTPPVSDISPPPSPPHMELSYRVRSYRTC